MSTRMCSREKDSEGNCSSLSQLKLGERSQSVTQITWPKICFVHWSEGLGSCEAGEALCFLMCEKYHQTSHLPKTSAMCRFSQRCSGTHACIILYTSPSSQLLAGECTTFWLSSDIIMFCLLVLGKTWFIARITCALLSCCYVQSRRVKNPSGLV